MSRLSLGYSPCPNDTFIFDAWVNNRMHHILDATVELLDVEQLNRKAQHAELDITKISMASYPLVSDRYQLLNAGSALGFGCGPLLVTRSGFEAEYNNNPVIAIPGKYTTANLLLSVFYPQWQNRTEALFSDIEDAVLSGRADVGLLIHESRFTYAEKGLVKLADLGEEWETKFRLPIPLGGIAVRRDFSESRKQEINRTLRRSLEFANAHPSASAGYISANAQEMSPQVQQMHIALYVNRFSIDLGDEGRQAILHLFNEGHKQGLLPECTQPVFISEEL
jgi:1,4-dihydroxy-6-naphthoate synthase